MARLRNVDPVSQVSRLEDAIASGEICRRELLAFGIAAVGLLPTVAYLTSLRLLRDLLLQGWAIDTDDEGILLAPPVAAAGDDPADSKEALRHSFAFARQAQLADPPTTRFIQDMERRGIARIFADGSELADRLADGVARGDLATAIRLTLELITPGARDELTGLILQDIWRYARHFWSIPYQSTPGRNLFYLVRDEAGPGRPIVGIAALGNAVLGLRQRDNALGWSIDSLRRRLSVASAAERRHIAQHLIQMVDAGIRQIFAEDLVEPGQPAREAIAHLERVERQASLQRRRELDVAGRARTAEYHLIRDAYNMIDAGKEDRVDWFALAHTQLYRRKRAGTLADLLRAATTFSEWGIGHSADAVLRMLDDEHGRRAAEIALRRIKQTAIAENVMEVITCGAVPPYGEILGGKLVAMLLASPRVVADVQDRYASRVSIIASAMKGEPVRRRPNLALLTTSSLYAVGSSQYNRIKIPGAVTGGSGTVTYQRFGLTQSFGTVHFAPDTAAGLLEATRLTENDRNMVNHLFGEGMSPKLRSLRAGLDALGLISDVFLRHHSPRLLYGAKLCHNTDELLFGLTDAPRYIISRKSDTNPV